MRVTNRSQVSTTFWQAVFIALLLGAISAILGVAVLIGSIIWKQWMERQ